MSIKINSQNITHQKPYRFLTYIVSIYTFCFILPSLLLRKIVDFPHVGVIPISILFTGTYFMLLDIVTEVYGYYEARRTLISGLISYTLFVFTMEMIINISSPDTFNTINGTVANSSAYNYLFSNIYLVWFSVTICSLFANTINIIILSKWKILIKGRYFWMRSVTTSLFAAIIYSFVSNIFAFGIHMKASQISYLIKLSVVSLIAKLLTLIVFSYPATRLCNFLKMKENVDIYDDNVNYNPLAAQPN